jgi:peptidoglycan glycosyltransferase
MTKQIRTLGIGLIICFVLLFVQLNRLTVFNAAKLNDNPNNTRDILRDFAQPRGKVLSADGVLLADSIPSSDRFVYQRVYPTKDLFSSVTGFFSFTLGSSGVEKVYNDELAGRTLDLSFQELGDLFVDKEHVGDLTLTLRNDLQKVAAEQLGQREGSVVAIDPRTGAILAMVSYPRYDPNLLADHDTAKAAATQKLMDADPEKPRLVRSYQERYFPGSTFKTVTATAGIEHGGVTPEQPSYPVQSSYHPPNSGTYQLRNFGAAARCSTSSPSPATPPSPRWASRPEATG